MVLLDAQGEAYDSTQYDAHAERLVVPVEAHEVMSSLVVQPSDSRPDADKK